VVHDTSQEQMKLKFEVQQKKCSQVYLLVCTAQAGICWIDQGTWFIFMSGKK